MSLPAQPHGNADAAVRFGPIWQLAVDAEDESRQGCLEKETQADRQKAQGCILLVEDNPADVLLLEESLELHNVDCGLVVITDGEKAVHYIDEVDVGAKVRPLLVVLDLNLPKRTGTEVLHRIRSSQPWMEIPVVILSSSNAPQDIAAAEALGARKYLRKPLNLEEFLNIGAILKEILSSKAENQR